MSEYQTQVANTADQRTLGFFQLSNTPTPTQPVSDPAVYGIECPESGRVYVGSTGNMKARESQHMTDLRRGKHHNPQLQAAFDHNQDVSFIVERTGSLEEARRREQEILDYGLPRGELLNKAPDAYNPGVGWERTQENVENNRRSQTGKVLSEETRLKMSEAHKGQTISEEHKAAISRANSGKVYTEQEKQERRESNPLVKPVLIEGAEYISISEAGRTLGLKKGTVQYRVESTTNKFSDWKYKENDQ